MASSLHPVLGQPSWALSVPGIRAWVTQLGGHLGPVSFHLKKGREPIEPFHVAPWAEEAQATSLPSVLRAMRGDFFCMPFGGNSSPFRQERHPSHGETANRRWHLEDLEQGASSSRLHLSLQTKIRLARVDKFIELRHGHSAVYTKHLVSDLAGPMSLGHHAMLRFRSPGRISTSPILGGQVAPTAFEKPSEGGYNCLAPGASFRSLKKVPMANGQTTDLTCYPAREGFEDIVMLSSKPGSRFAWTAAVFPEEGYVWFSLKDPRVLSSTLLWHSNGGRHYPPWNGRHRAVLGLEEVTSWFHYGLAESVRHHHPRRPTVLQSKAGVPLKICTIMAVAAIPKNFDSVGKIQPIPKGVALLSRNGKKIEARLDLSFLSR